MSFKLWIDSQAHDPEATAHHPPDEDYRVATNLAAAIAICKWQGVPSHVDMDYAFEDGDNVITFLNWLEKTYQLRNE